MFQCVVSQVVDTMRSTELRTVSVGSVEAKNQPQVSRGGTCRSQRLVWCSALPGVQWGGAAAGGS